MTDVKLNRNQAEALRWLRSHGQWVTFRQIDGLGYKISSVCKLVRLGLAEVRRPDGDEFSRQQWRAAGVDVVAAGSVLEPARELESDEGARRLAAMMWLEYAMDADSIPPPGGITKDLCIEYAHVMLQGPRFGEDGDEFERIAAAAWLTARNATVIRMSTP